MPVSTVVPRYAAVIGLAFALLLGASLSGHSEFAEAATKAQCQNRYVNCDLRCSERAGKKNGINANSSQADQEKAGADYNACTQRTCSNQLKGCMASASDAKKAPLTQQGAVRPPSNAATKLPLNSGGLLERAPLNPQGPAATGTPIAPAPAPAQLR